MGKLCWNAINVDGHNLEQLLDVLSKRYDKPTVIIAKTVKGKGISFAENNPDWHVNSFTQEQYEIAKKEVSEV